MKVFSFLLVFTLLMLCNFSEVKSQINPADSLVSVSLIRLEYTHEFPFADMSDRFGNNSAIGLGYQYKFKNNWIAGANFRFRTNANVNQDDILDEITTEEDWLIGQDGLLVEYRLVQRGWSGDFTFGRVFPLFGPNENSGLVLEAGVGFLTHKIHIDLRDQEVPALRGDYLKGYDRLSIGPSFSQSVGYLHLGSNRLINFYFGIEFKQALTQNIRKWNFDEGQAEEGRRTDLLLGLKAAWYLPIYPRRADSYQFFY